jgi:hypothetical protein
VIFTNGIIQDYQSTIDAVVECAECAPLSIIFIGIGDGDFSKLDE